MIVAVTGAGGLTGGAVVAELAARGVRVRAIVRAAGRVHEAFETRVADLCDPGAAERALAGADVLIHVAGITLGPVLARLPALARARRVVVVSSAAVRSRHRASAALYRAGEDALRAVRPDVTVVRPTMIYGSVRDRNVHHAIAFARRFRVLPLFGDGTARLQPIHYADVAAAVAALAEVGEPGTTIEAGGGAPVTLEDAARAIFAALGLRPRLMRLPLGPSAAVAMALERRRDGRIAERILRFAEDRTVDNAMLLAATGVRPRQFARGVADEVREMGLA